MISTINLILVSNLRTNMQKKIISNEDEFIVIKFEAWSSSKEYREIIANSLDYKNSDKNLKYISDAGNGSSLGSVEGLNERWLQSDSKDMILKLINNDETLFMLGKLYPEVSMQLKKSGFGT